MPLAHKALAARDQATREIRGPSTPGSHDHVHTKVHTFTATSGGALKRVEALNPRNISQVQRDFWPDRLFPKLKLAGSNLVSRSILTRR